MIDSDEKSDERAKLYIDDIDREPAIGCHQNHCELLNHMGYHKVMLWDQYCSFSSLTSVSFRVTTLMDSNHGNGRFSRNSKTWFVSNHVISAGHLYRDCYFSFVEEL